MNNSENATTVQFLQLVANFAQILPLTATKVEVQKVIENENDPLWVAIVGRFAQVVKNVLADMIAAGKYDWVNSNINEENFSPETLALGSEPKLYHFNCNTSLENAITLMDKDGYRPGTLGDILTYGAKNPEEQREYPIIALGSVVSVGGSRYVACLAGDDSERGLDLYWFGGGWGARYRFLAVCK